MAKTEIQKTDADPNAVPAYLQAYAKDAGNQDNFDSSDVAIPQVKLLQGTSPQVQDYDTARSGEFWHTGMDLPLGKDLKFIVCSRRKKYLLQAPMDDGQGILARADDAKTWDKLGSWEVKIDKKTTATWAIDNLDVAGSGLTSWGTYDPDDENSPPAATLFYEYLVLLPDHLDLGPAVITLARSQIRKAKKGLNDKIALHQSNKRPMQAIVFSAKPVSDQNDSGQDYSNWQFTGAGFAPEDLFLMAQKTGEELGDYKVQDEGSIDEPLKADSDEY